MQKSKVASKLATKIQSRSNENGSTAHDGSVENERALVVPIGGAKVVLVERAQPCFARFPLFAGLLGGILLQKLTQISFI